MSSDKLDELWNRAHEQPGLPVDIGRLVVCDNCDKDYTDLTDSGGFLFASYAVCPICAPDALRDIADLEELQYIRARCPPGMPFSDFIRQQRGGNTTILVDRIT